MPNNLLGGIGDFLSQTGQTLVGGAIGQLFAKQNDARQLVQAQKLQDQNIAGQEQLTDYNYNTQLKMWNATNYSAQMDQLNKAGLNPALLYGGAGSGGGGSTSIDTGSVPGQQAPVGGKENVAMAGEMANLGLLRAQKENIEADTKNKEASATNTQADTLNKPKVGQQIDTSIKGMQLDQKFQQASFNDRLDMIENTTDNMLEQLKQNVIKSNMDSVTQVEKANQIKAESIGAVLQNAIQKSQELNIDSDTKNKIQALINNKQELQNMIQENSRRWQSLSLDERKTIVQEKLGNVAVTTAIFGAIDKVMSLMPK